MNLDELKNVWKEYDQKLSTQSLINENLIKNMVKAKSHSALEKMRREYIFTFIYLSAFTVFCILSVLGNAFDYTHLLHYIPLVLYILASFLILGLLLHGFKISRMEIDKEHLLGSIQKVLQLHRKYLSRTAKAKLLFVFSGFLFPFSFFPRIYADKGFWPAAGLVLLTVATIALLILLFKKMGVFRDRYSEMLENALQELNEYEELNPRPNRMI